MIINHTSYYKDIIDSIWNGKMFKCKDSHGLLNQIKSIDKPVVV